MILRLSSALLFATGIACAAPARQDPGDAPNLVLILCDDLGFGDLACFGHPAIETPNLDALAKSGRTLTAMYAAAPMCSPSRAGLLTGRSSHRSGIYDWIPHDGTSKVHLRREETTIADVLRGAGYETSLFGKWHLNSEFNRDTQPQPDDQGFDHWFATQFNPSHENPTGFVENGRALPRLAGQSCDLVVQRAVDWLRHTRDPKRRFFQFLSFHEPHHPVAPPRALVERYSEQARNRDEATYFASVHSLDRAVGRYLAALRELDLEDDTLVLFTSDHGPQRRRRGIFRHSYGRSTPFRGTKRTLYEGGLRVPTVVRWPGHIGPGTTSDAPVGFVDLLPTFAGLAGAELPKRELDGEDVRATFLSNRPRPRTKPLHWHFYAPLAGPQSALRDGRWMLTAEWSVEPGAFRGGTRRIPEYEAKIRGATLRSFRLYDLEVDPGQKRDVAATHVARTTRMAARLRALFADVQQDAPRWAKTKERPNILLIVSEDNGPEIGCYGDAYARTPHLDALAGRGVRFARAFVPYSVCSPSRACFLTGLYPQQNGQLGLATHRFAMYSGVETLPVRLAKHGYRTGLIGKLHVNPKSAFAFDFHRIKGANFGKRDVAKYAAAAAEFFRASDKPFFLSVNYPDAHFPLHRQQFGRPAKPITKEEVKPLPWIGADSERLREFTANYYNCLARLDDGVGLLLAELDKAGKSDNTMIVYIGDHGAQFSRGKCSVYEAGLRIPMIVSWSGRAKRAHVARELVSTLDLVPTIYRAVGIDVPRTLPGKPLQPLLAGRAEKLHDHVFAMTTGAAPTIGGLRFSVRDERYKLIWTPYPDRDNRAALAYRNRLNRHFAAGTLADEIARAPEHVRRAYQRYERPPEFELFDLDADEHEWHDLARDPAKHEVLTRLKNELAAWQAEIRDPLAIESMRDAFMREFEARLDGAHRKGDYEWPYVTDFAAWRKR